MKTCFKILLLTACLLALLSASAFAETVAKIGNTPYESIQAAVDRAKDGDTIVVTKSHTMIMPELNEQLCSYPYFICIKDKDITIDLNGMAVKTEDRQDPADNMLIVCVNATDSTSAHLTLKDSSAAQTGRLIGTSGGSTYGLLIALHNNSSITVDGGSYELDRAEDSLIYASENEKVTINGGNFHLDNVGERGPGDGKNYSPWIFNVRGNNQRHVIVNDGTFNWDVKNQYWKYEVQIPSSKALKNNGDGTWTVVDAAVSMDEDGYATLNEALAKVEESSDGNNTPEEICVLKDCEVTEKLTVDESVDINLNGKKIYWQGDLNELVVTIADGKTLRVMESENGNPIAWNVERIGHTFQMWHTGNEEQYPFPQDGLTGPISLYASFEANEYTITWMSEGEKYTTTTQKFDEALELPAQPAGSSEFLGWYTEDGRKVEAGEIYKTPGHVTYYARYEEIPQGVVLPGTGDDSRMALYVLLLGAAIAGLTLVRRRVKA